MEIGILGSGNIGGTLARHLTALGHTVSIANSRGPASLAALAAETGATAATVEQAARARDVVIVAVPEAAVPTLSRDILAASSAVVVDTGNYYPSRDGHIAEIDGGLTDSEWVARVLGRPVVKAFNNIVATSLATRGAPAGTPGRICLSVAGDEPHARQQIVALLDALGFDGRHAGLLSRSGPGRTRSRSGAGRCRADRRLPGAGGRGRPPVLPAAHLTLRRVTSGAAKAWYGGRHERARDRGGGAAPGRHRRREDRDPF
jgi:predicted dinucleotide-binding enzyme